MSKSKHPKRSGYFCVSKRAIDAILDARLSADHILAFLVVAGFSYTRTGSGSQLLSVRQRKDGSITEFIQPSSKLIKLSNASAKAVEKYSGINRRKASTLLQDLCSVRCNNGGLVLFSVEGWNKYVRSYPMCSDELGFDDLHEKPKALPFVINQKDNAEVVRFVLNNFNEKKDRQVWLPKELISGVSTKSPKMMLSLPLKALKQLREHKDGAVRMLLAAYRYRDHRREKYVDPEKGFSFSYDLEGIADINKVTLRRTTTCEFTVAPSLEAKVIDSESASCIAIFEQLIKLGLFYCDVIVHKPKTMGYIWYVLSSRALGGVFRKNIQSSANEIEGAIRKQGYQVAENYGKNNYRFRKGYPVLSYANDVVTVKGLLFLRIDLKDAISEQDSVVLPSGNHFVDGLLLNELAGIKREVSSLGFAKRKRLIDLSEQ